MPDPTKKNSPWWLILNILATAVGVWEMFRGVKHVGYPSLLVIFGVFGVFAHFLSPKWARASARLQAKMTFRARKAIYTSPYEWKPINPADFPRRHIAFHDHVRDELVRQGFTFLAEREKRVSRKAPGYFAYRVLLGDGGTIQSLLYLKYSNAIGFETELSDGSFLITSNFPGGAKYLQAPRLGAVHLPKHTSAAELLGVHRQRLAQRAAGLEPIVMGDVDDIFRSQSRQHAIRKAFRWRLDFDEAADLQLRRGRQLDSMDHLILKELDRLRRADPELGGSGPADSHGRDDLA